jgi:hypothetical protein
MRQLKLFKPELVRHTKGVGFAAQWLKDLLTPGSELYEWIEVRRRRFSDNQIQFVDQITDCYRPVFSHMPPAVSVVFWNLCRFYGAGTSSQHLTSQIYCKQNSVSSILSRLVKFELVAKKNKGIYFVPHKDLLRYFALRSDSRFTGIGPAAETIDLFIERIEYDVCKHG